LVLLLLWQLVRLGLGCGEAVSVGTAVGGIVGSGLFVAISLITVSVVDTGADSGLADEQAASMIISNVKMVIFRLWCMVISSGKVSKIEPIFEISSTLLT